MGAAAADVHDVRPAVKLTSPSRPARTLGILLAGVALFSVGVLVANAAGGRRDACHYNAWIRGLLNERSASCTALDVRFDAGLGAMGLGAVITALAVGLLILGGRRAARSGSPWPARRTAEAAARWLDGRLPGNARVQPRLRPGFVSALGLVLVLAAGTGVASARHRHNQDEQTHAFNLRLAAFNRAEGALYSLTLPSSFRRSDCAPAQICARTTLTPTQALPILERLIHGTASPAAENPLNQCRPGRVCFDNVDIQGSIAGYPATAYAFRWPLRVRHGRPPDGATRITGAPPGSYWDGSSVGIGIASPDPY